jgi:autoinducer 2 (AI-2) kinase
MRLRGFAGHSVVTGGDDTQCGLLSAGAVDSGQIAIIAGSTMPLQWVLEREFTDAQARLWTSHHIAQGRWTLESNGGPSGDMIDWLAGVIYSGLGDPAAALFAEASQSVVGAEGIVSTLGAEVFNASRLRLPLGHLTLSPMMVGDDPSRRRHLSRAVVEGLAFALRGNLELLQKALQNGSVQSVRLAGGMSKSAFFAQLLSDVLGVPVEAAQVPECSALGAAICAGVGARLYANVVDGAKRFACGLRSFVPDPSRRAAYQLYYDRWLEVGAARQEADELAESNAIEAIMGKAAENSARDATKTSAPRPISWLPQRWMKGWQRCASLGKCAMRLSRTFAATRRRGSSRRSPGCRCSSPRWTRWTPRYEQSAGSAGGCFLRGNAVRRHRRARRMGFGAHDPGSQRRRWPTSRSLSC